VLDNNLLTINSSTFWSQMSLSACAFLLIDGVLNVPNTVYKYTKMTISEVLVGTFSWSP